MSGLDLLEAEELVSETVTKPPSRWFNWWRARFRQGCLICCVSVEAGEAYSNACGHCGDGPFPSADVAKTKADLVSVSARMANEYLGAFPEGGRP
jgi:hypothetical protein